MKAVLSYLIVLFSAAVYMILFDRSAGSIMTVFLIVVPLLSISLTLAARKWFEFDAKFSDEMIKKNSTAKLFVLVKKKTVFPVPILSFEMSVSERISPLKHDVYRFSMSGRKDLSIDIDLIPEICGTADIHIKNIYITDYLGVFRFRLKVPEIRKTISILPDIYDIEDSGDILRSIYSTLPDNDDDDAAPVMGKTAFPGYEYRNYIPGDSLKKINWKLSSKRNQLFVRLDEASGMTLPDIILDLSPLASVSKNKRYSLLMEEKITEGALSLLALCVKNGIECTFSYIEDGVRQKENVSCIEDAEKIAAKLSKISFKKSDIPLLCSQHSKSSDVSVLYTLDLSDNIINAAEESVLNGNSVKTILPESIARNLDTGMTDIWSLGDDHTIRRVS